MENISDFISVEINVDVDTSDCGSYMLGACRCLSATPQLSLQRRDVPLRLLRRALGEDAGYRYIGFGALRP